MISIKLTLLVTTALASLAIATLTVQSQNVAVAFNEKNNRDVSNTHNHLRFSGDEGLEGIHNNNVYTSNNDEMHMNSNYNSEREENYKENIHEKPNTGGNGDDEETSSDP